MRFAALDADLARLSSLRAAKETYRWSRQIPDTIDYCGFIDRDPGSSVLTYPLHR